MILVINLGKQSKLISFPKFGFNSYDGSFEIHAKCITMSEFSKNVSSLIKSLISLTNLRFSSSRRSVKHFYKEIDHKLLLGNFSLITFLPSCQHNLHHQVLV